jgi:thiosulfate dehydrogenase [quinone] large subunit
MADAAIHSGANPMTTMTLGGTTSAAIPAHSEAKSANWRIAALALLSVRVMQGFIYWGGGSRRFIYAPSKLDPHRASWMANKFQSAMPGALLGTDHIIAFLLHHFYLLYTALIVFSTGELIAGVFLMAGFLTRAAALASVGFSIVLMLMFGWQGATCIDEWTMAAANLAMGATLILAGSGAFSADNALLHRSPQLARRAWFRWFGGSLPLPLSDVALGKLALGVLAAVVAFNVATYSYYRGSVVTPFHGGPVSPARHHLTLSQGTVQPDGSVRFHVYLDGGTPAEPANILEASLVSATGTVLEQWNGAALGDLPATAIVNDFAYNRFAPGPFGLSAEVGAEATVTLPTRQPASLENAETLRLRTVNGHTFALRLATP